MRPLSLFPSFFFFLRNDASTPRDRVKLVKSDISYFLLLLFFFFFSLFSTKPDYRGMDASFPPTFFFFFFPSLDRGDIRRHMRWRSGKRRADCLGALCSPLSLFSPGRRGPREEAYGSNGGFFLFPPPPFSSPPRNAATRGRKEGDGRSPPKFSFSPIFPGKTEVQMFTFSFPFSPFSFSF